MSDIQLFKESSLVELNKSFSQLNQEFLENKVGGNN